MSTTAFRDSSSEVGFGADVQGLKKLHPHLPSESGSKKPRHVWMLPSLNPSGSAVLLLQGLMNVQEESEYKNVFEAHGEDWKRLRTTINPVFTANRMRQVLQGTLEPHSRWSNSCGTKYKVVRLGVPSDVSAGAQCGRHSAGATGGGA